MKPFRTILLLVVGLALSCPAYAHGSLASQGKESTPQIFTSNEGGFSIGLPGNAKPECRSFNNDKGHYESCELSWVILNVGSYRVRYMNWPTQAKDNAQAKGIIDDLGALLVSKNKGLKLVRNEEISIEGYPGREIIFEDSKGIYIKRMYLAGKRSYELSVFLPNSLRSQQVLALKTLDTFRLNQPEEEALGEADALITKLREKGEPIYSLLAHQIDNLVSKPTPAYPAIAKAARVQGTVSVKVVVDEEGRIIAAQALSGHPLLKSAAVAAARQVVLSPTLLDGKPVKVVGVIEYNFALQ